jgi:methylated-DNA-[protein]-cysteine S-methyltransferase
MHAGCIWVASVPTPWGPAWIGASDDGVVALELMTTAEAFEAALTRRRFGCVRHVATAEGEAGAALAVTAGERVAAALEGDDAGLDQLPVDLSDRPPWDRAVLDAVHGIPRGETASYGEIARRIGRAGAAQAVGGAVGRNPVGLLIPCHRVIASDGTLGGYGVAAFGGREAALEIKRRLLELEGAIPQPRGTGRIG